MSDYQPISCNFYDELEALATRRQPAEIRYRAPDAAAEASVTGVIADLYIRDKVEYLRLTDGFELRLDWLVAVDGKELRGYC
ncbi:hypothetical protein LJY25_05535 [Hymenobacter sp. BT175]|uniref:hypothetical protein n=1 Tax=Hymenobacter translucens TaxID=2886507 RepID=UPI001D0E0157|nr:hypothetical protein [Hymenobacter translucens]MCC2545898.1 hypothetical protein [Hymenobacter translucens]